jgi:hypothetical protein
MNRSCVCDAGALPAFAADETRDRGLVVMGARLSHSMLRPKQIQGQCGEALILLLSC